MVERDWKVADEGAVRLCEGREIAPHRKCSMVGNIFLHGALSGYDGSAGKVPTAIKAECCRLKCRRQTLQRTRERQGGMVKKSRP